jgi:hypothetical protein
MTRITTLTDAIFDVGGVLYTLDYDRMLKNFSRLCREPIEKIKAVLYEEKTFEINAEAIKDALESISSHITYSFRTGYLKPDHRIFRIALEKASKDLKEILYIDDSEENIRAARELGIPSYLFESEEGLLKIFEQFGIVLL